MILSCYLRVVKCMSQSPTAVHWSIWDLYPSHLSPEPVFCESAHNASLHMAHPGTDSKRQHQICRKGSTYRREGGAGKETSWWLPAWGASWRGWGSGGQGSEDDTEENAKAVISGLFGEMKWDSSLSGNMRVRCFFPNPGSIPGSSKVLVLVSVTVRGLVSGLTGFSLFSRN